ncbi:hypothetical protein KOR42_37330 [Thalassoglobus neptunius]|uniref:Uncharacterized protein n=1 Tax=Thalassoglobus neptunius TaxID=1938619 RepID=A0A5C5WII8_9PLAN|nr:hypothetical protein KOR42_37330 [Thalassoglobus neptunius]
MYTFPMHRTANVQNSLAGRRFSEAVCILSPQHSRSIAGLEIASRMNRKTRMLFVWRTVGDRGIRVSAFDEQSRLEFSLYR